MGFQNNVLAGSNLIRDAIQSPNFVHGQSGWQINRDGTAEFNDITARGSITAGDFRSANYVAGTSGFDLNADTNQIEINSGFRVGGTTTPHLTLGAVPNSSAFGIVFDTADPGQVQAGDIVAGTTPGVTGSVSVIEIDSPASTPTGGGSGTVNGHSFLQMAGSTTTLLGGVTLGDTSAPVGGNTVLSSILFLNSYQQARFTSVQPISAGENAMITGNPAGTSIRYSGSEIQAIAAGPATSTLSLNPAGSTVTFGAGITATAMRAASALAIATSTTITSTSYVDFATLSVNFTAPASGVVYVDARGLMQITNGAAALQRALMAFVIRNTNGSGTLFRGATDREAVDFGVVAGATGRLQSATSGVVTGLTPGNVYAVNMALRTSDAGGTTSVSLFDCNIIVIPSM